MRPRLASRAAARGQWRGSTLTSNTPARAILITFGDPFTLWDTGTPFTLWETGTPFTGT